MAAPTPSSPGFLSSFDPAIYLHSEPPDGIPPSDPISESHTDELEALNIQRLEIKREKTRQGIVIQHRTWQLADVFRSDDDIRPETPSKRSGKQIRTREDLFPDLPIPSSPPTAKMPLISSPVHYPPSSSPVARMNHQKRKLGEPSKPTEPKRQKIVGGFIDDEDDNDDVTELEAFQEAQSQEQDGEESQNFAPLAFENTSTAAAADITVPTNKDGSSNDQTSEPSQSHKKSSASATKPKYTIKLCSGKTHTTQTRNAAAPISYERLVAERSVTAPGRAKKSYYGIDIHRLLDDASQDAKVERQLQQARKPDLRPSIEPSVPNTKKASSMMWTEKYRARKFTDLIGDERTHRSVLRWLKAWDSIVFPGLDKTKPKKRSQNETEERAHRKVLLLTGPPGLGKTTLAHVCARQAGYEILEINASDERSRDVVKGRIRDAVGTENVKGTSVQAGDRKIRKAGRPVCVVVDEVDGVVSGSGGSGEGGFMKALIDLVTLDQKNSNRIADQSSGKDRRDKKGDRFRLLRPLILVCNDVYHPSLRPLRTANIAEIIHVRKPPLDKVVQRLKTVFDKEGFASDADGVRRLCEASWGLGDRREGRANSRGVGEGDIRTVLVAGEWVAHKLRSSSLSGVTSKLTRAWVEKHILNDSLRDSAASRGLGGGSVREVVERVFLDGAGFPGPRVGTETFSDPFAKNQIKTPVGVADIRKRHAINRLREMVDTSGDYDRCITDCFSTYPTRTYQDDTFLSKPNAAYDWLHFHDAISSRIYSNQDWELNPYLSQSVVAFHHLFSSSSKRNFDLEKPNETDEEEQHPFAGPRADFSAFEAEKHNRSVLVEFQSSFSAPLLRTFRSTDSIVTDLIPSLIRMLAPEVKPVVVGGSGDQKSVASVRKESERALVRSAVRVMSGLGITFEKVRVESETGAHGGFVYRMEPPLDTLTQFHRVQGVSGGPPAPVRYAIRQVLDQELSKESLRRQAESQQAKYSKDSGDKSKKPGPGTGDEDKENEDKLSKSLLDKGAKRDFFGRIINESRRVSGDDNEDNGRMESAKGPTKERDDTVWVSYHEGFSNAVRKPISLGELLAGL